MALYEHIYLARQDVTPQQVETMTEQFKTVIEANGGSIAKLEYWGVKTLAYRIKKNRKAHFTLMNINAPAAAVAEMEREPRVGPLDFLDRGLDADAHKGAVGRCLEAVDNRARVIRHREHAAILFGLRADPAFGEPGDGVARLEAMERAEELPASARVFLYQLGRLEAAVGHIASAPAGDPHLGEEVRRGLKERHHPAPA